MKKIISAVIALIFVLLAVPFTAAAAETEIAPENTIVETTQNDGSEEADAVQSADRVKITNVGLEGISVIHQWNENGYPNDIGFVLYESEGYNPSSGNTTLHTSYIIYVVKGTSDERKAELISLMGTDRVEFRECSVSRNALLEYGARLKSAVKDYAYDVLASAKYSDLALVVYYPEENDAKIKALIKSDFSEIENIVELKVGVDPSELDGNGIFPEIFIEEIDVKPSENRVMPYLFAALLALAALSALVIARRARAKKLVLSNGETATAPSVPSRKEVEREISASSVSPSISVMDNIKKNM